MSTIYTTHASIIQQYKSLIALGWEVLNSGVDHNGCKFHDVYPPAGQEADTLYTFTQLSDTVYKVRFVNEEGEVVITRQI